MPAPKKKKQLKAKIADQAVGAKQAPKKFAQLASDTWRLEHDVSTKHHKLWQYTTLASVSLLGLLIIGMGLLFGVANGSLAPVYLGSVPIEVTASEAEIAKKVSQAKASYKFTLLYPDKTQKTFLAEVAGITIDSRKSAESAKSALHKSFLDRLKWWQPIHLPLETKVDPVQMDSFITSYATRTEAGSQNANLSAVDGVIVLTPEKEGQGYSVTNSSKTIPGAVAAMSTKPLVLTKSILKPRITSKDLQASKAKAEAIVAQSVSFKIGWNTIKTAPAEVASWIDFTPVPSSKTVDVTVNGGKVLEYIDAIAEDYTTPVRNRTIISTNGGEIVVDEGSDGRDILNKDEVAANATKRLIEGKGVEAEMQVKYVKAKTTALPAQAKWFLANVSTKRMYAYEGSKLVRTFLISAGAPDTPTVLGRYKVYAKYRVQDMRGLNTDGSRYYQPNVPYVLYFTGSYAIHGNYWRPASWFGNVNSSHGCLGVTVADGAWIYDWAPIGTPVITQS